MSKNIRKAMTTDEFRVKFPDEETVAKYVAFKRWGDQPRCYFCDSTRCVVWRGDRAGYYRCKDCRKQFSVKHGSIFEGSRIPLLKWLWAFYHLTVNRKGMSSTTLCSYLDLCQPTTHSLLQRVRKVMGRHKKNYVTKGGKVEVDERYHGANPKNMHARKRYGRKPIAVVFGMRERDGYTITKHVENNKKETLQPEIERHVKPGSEIDSDGHKSYNGLSKKGYIHNRVDHSEGQYVDGDTYTNSMESAWAVQERAFYGIYHNCDRENLNLYQNEFDYRLNMGSRQMSTMDAIDKLIADCWIFTGCYNRKHSVVIMVAEFFGRLKADLRRRKYPGAAEHKAILRKFFGMPPEPHKRQRLQEPRIINYI